MSDYIERPKDKQTGRAMAAVYRPGEPLDDLRRVARKADPDADVVEVAEWGVLLVRHEEIPDHARSYIDYDVVQPGQLLIWSKRSYSLYVDDVADFEREWMRADG
jgi:hypothetical protein